MLFYIIQAMKMNILRQRVTLLLRCAMGFVTDWKVFYCFMVKFIVLCKTLGTPLSIAVIVNGYQPR